MTHGETGITDQDGARTHDRRQVVIHRVAHRSTAPAGLPHLHIDPGNGGRAGPVTSAQIRGDRETTLEEWIGRRRDTARVGRQRLRARLAQELTSTDTQEKQQTVHALILPSA